MGLGGASLGTMISDVVVAGGVGSALSSGEGMWPSMSCSLAMGSPVPDPG